MEILELIVALVEGAGCVLELLAAIGWVGTGSAGVQVGKQVKKRRAAEVQRAAQERTGVPLPAQEQEQAPEGYERSMWLFLIFLVLSMFLTGLTLWKWVH